MTGILILSVISIIVIFLFFNRKKKPIVVTRELRHIWKIAVSDGRVYYMNSFGIVWTESKGQRKFKHIEGSEADGVRKAVEQTGVKRIRVESLNKDMEFWKMLP